MRSVKVALHVHVHFFWRSNWGCLLAWGHVWHVWCILEMVYLEVCLLEVKVTSKEN